MEGTYDVTQTSQWNQPIFVLLKPSDQPAFPGKIGPKTSLDDNFRRTHFIRLLKPAAKPAFTGGNCMSADFDVRYTAQLARLDLSETEAARFQEQLSHILGYVEKLKEVNVEGVKPTAHSSELYNVFRADSERDWFTSEQALANAPRQANGLFIVTKVIE